MELNVNSFKKVLPKEVPCGHLWIKFSIYFKIETGTSVYILEKNIRFAVHRLVKGIKGQ